MGIVYNKKFQSKDQKVMPTGPRDRQLRQTNQTINYDQSLLIDELRSQISKLQEQLDNKSSISGYTPEQVDEEIVKSVKLETLNLKTQHEIEKNKLQNKIESLEETIQQLKFNQDNNSILTEEKITALILEATKNMSSNSESIVANARPQMETVFVDPAEIDGDVENHISIPETFPIEKEDMNSKVNKLKDLLGKLPSRKDNK
jgi:hypothetical protein